MKEACTTSDPLARVSGAHEAYELQHSFGLEVASYQYTRIPFSCFLCFSWRTALCYISVMHVFTYGTLMFPEVWRAVVGREFATVDGVADGYAIFRVQDAVFPGIMAAGERDQVRGVVYLDVDHASLTRLDLFEDDFYVRQSLWIDCEDGERRSADAYVVPSENQSVLSDDVWNRATFLSSGGLEHFIRRFQGFVRIENAEQ
jgi:gamma-glutamylcyclotransferase (GGCT)/AIG2-like uncharacterized protein YtfP